MVIQSGIIGGVCLAVVYFGLVLVGATYSGQFGADVDHTALLNAIVHDLLGNFGTWLMSIIALFATITSMIGAVGSVGEFFEDITKKKLPYAWTVAIITIISYILSNGGVEAILQYSAPIVFTLFPGIIYLVIMTLFTRYINNDNVYRFGVAGALICGLLDTLGAPFMSGLPLAGVGLGWVVPAAILSIIGAFVKYKGYESRPYLRENAALSSEEAAS
jgi:LIVCS family branched-chain amino acid:cation transporter